MPTIPMLGTRPTLYIGTVRYWDRRHAAPPWLPGRTVATLLLFISRDRLGPSGTLCVDRCTTLQYHVADYACILMSKQPWVR